MKSCKKPPPDNQLVNDGAQADTGLHHRTLRIKRLSSHLSNHRLTTVTHTSEMPSRSEIAYFGAGPAPLPTAVVDAGARAFVNYNDSGLGLGEISHRSPAANQILADTKTNLTTLLDIPENYEILFLQGGGTGEFSAIVQNLISVWVERRRRRLAAQFGDDETKVVAELKKQVDEELKLDYIVTGSWSSKAAQEGKRLVGEKFVNVAVDAKEANGGKFGKIPAEEEWKLTKTKKEGGKSAPAFVYFCDNETVDGVEFPSFPKVLENPQDVSEEDERLVVADMSSNFLSRKIDVKKYAVIFVSDPMYPLYCLKKKSAPMLRYNNLSIGRSSEKHWCYGYRTDHCPKGPSTPPYSHAFPSFAPSA